MASPVGSEATTRLTALDAAFLHFETDRTPAHVGTLAFFEGAPFRDEQGRFRLADVRARIQSRLHLVPRLRQVIVPTPLGIDHPVLADDRYFDIVHHVKLVEVGAPADEHAVFELAASLHMERLDRDRPLWELCFVDGMADGRVAMIEKIHHAIVDGISGVEIATVLLDLEPDTPDKAAPAWYPHAWDGPVERLVKGIAHRLALPVQRLVEGVRGRGSGDHVDVTAITRSLALAPRSSLNAEIGHHRRLEPVRRDLGAARKGAHEHGGKVNDLVLAAVTSGLRTLLLHRGEHLDPSTPALRALVPVSLHTEEGDLGNLVASLMVELPVGVADPTERMQRIIDATSGQKLAGTAAASGRLLHAADLLPPRVAALVSRAVHKQPFVNLVVTNVPGPDVPLYGLGARMLDAVPIVPLAGNLSVSVGVLSYDGALVLGIYGDPDVKGDFDVLVRGIDDGFTELGCVDEPQPWADGTTATGQGA